MKLWQKKTALDKQIERFTVGEDPQIDLQLIKYDCQASIAHARMLKKIGILKSGESEKLIKELNRIADLAEKNKFNITQEQEDGHTAIEMYLTKKLGDLGKKIHTARSRNDQVLAALRLYYKEKIGTCEAAIHQLNHSLDQLIKASGSVRFPGYTHTRKAMASSVRLWADAFSQSMTDNLKLLGTAKVLIDRSPLGTGAGYGIPLDVDRPYTAKIAGFKEPQQNALYVQNSRGKFESTLIHTLGQIMIDLNRMATDLIFFSIPELGYVSLPETFCTGSSIMPQKKNPDTAEIMRAKSGVVNGDLVRALTCMKALPMSYNRDMQDLTPALWEALETTGQCLDLLRDMLVTAEFNINRMREEAKKGYSTATDLADMLVREFGIPFRTAHGIVGRAVRKGVIDSDSLEEASREVGGPSLKACGVTDEQIAKALNGDCSIAARDVQGGPAPAAARAHIRERMECRDQDTLWSQEARVAIKLAYEEMLQYAWELIEY